MSCEKAQVWDECMALKLTVFDHRHQIYFDKIHPSVPMIHKYRYLAAMNLYAHLLFGVLFIYACADS